MGKINLLWALPPELLLEIAAYLDCTSQYRLLQMCRCLHALLAPGLKWVPDKHGNNRYLYKLLKTGNITEIEAWPGTPASVLFTLEGPMLERYQQTARPQVRTRMQEVSAPRTLYPCLRLSKSGLMVALDHEQWETAAFLLRRDRGRIGFLGTKEHFWAALVYRNWGAMHLTYMVPNLEKKPVASHASWKPPLWEQLFTNTRWIGCLLDGGEDTDIATLLDFIYSKMEEQDH